MAAPHTGPTAPRRPRSPSVVVVVVCWNCRDDIEACLLKLRENTRYEPCRFVFIDNLSTDGTREWLSAERDRLAASAREGGGEAFELVPVDENLGWVRAVNLALTRYEADYFFFLNPDAFVEPDWLAPLVAALEEEPRAGFASSVFRYLDGTVHFAGAYVSPTAGLRSDGTEVSPGRRPVPFAHGQCLVRAATAREVGLLDEGFGLGLFEGVEYQLRARRFGWTALLVPESVIVHASARAFNQRGRGFKEELFLRNWLRVITLHWPVGLLLGRLPIEVLRTFRSLAAGADAGPVLRAWAGWLRMMPEIVERRAAIRRTGAKLDFSALRRRSPEARRRL